MKIFAITLLMSTLSFAGPGHGHGHGHGNGHGHSAPAISKDKTEEAGKKHIQGLIKAGKLDKSWKNAKHDKSEKKQFNGRTEWVVTFNNDKGVKGKKLYIFLKESGSFVAANFTGK